MGRLMIWLLALVMSIAGGGFFYAAYEAREAAPILVEAKAAAERAASDGLEWGDLSSQRQQIFLRVVDPAFFEHPGFDIQTPGVGPQTLTQDLAAQLFPHEGPQWLAFVRNAILAREIHQALSKDEQLTIYLNLSPIGIANGRMVVGFPAGAQAYFSTSVDQLSDAQFLVLTARLKDPLGYSRPGGQRVLDARLARLERLLAGQCAPRGPRDDAYPDCA